MSRIVILPPDQAVSLNPLHSGFAHGYGLFETMLVQDGKLQFWRSHWERLTHSAASLGFHFELAMENVLSAISRYCREANVTQSGIIKLSLMAEGHRSVLYVYGRPPMPHTQTAELQLDLRYPINQQSLLAGHKTHNYMENLHLLQLARTAGYSDGVRLNTNGFLAETCVANLFFVRDKTVFTPSLACGVLPGVIRQAIIDLSEASNVTNAWSLTCGEYTLNDLRQADAVFLTNASVGILPVISLTSESGKLEWNSPAHPVVRDIRQKLQVATADQAVSLVE